MDDWREKVESLVSEDKAMEKSFKKDFAGADEFVPVLFQLFRRRVNKDGTPAARAQVRRQMFLSKCNREFENVCLHMQIINNFPRFLSRPRP